jgi:hypothetical protein
MRQVDSINSTTEIVISYDDARSRTTRTPRPTRISRAGTKKLRPGVSDFFGGCSALSVVSVDAVVAVGSVDVVVVITAAVVVVGALVVVGGGSGVGTAAGFGSTAFALATGAGAAFAEGFGAGFVTALILR